MLAIAGPNLPLDLLAAAGRFAGAVSFDPERDTPRADDWLESKFAPWAFPVLEAWAEDEYDQFEQVLFSRADDTSQRLYYYICELQRRGQIGGPEPLILDIAKIPRAASRDRMITKLRELGEHLGVSADALESAIVETNSQRAAKTPKAGDPICLLTGTAPPDERLHDRVRICGFAPTGATLVEEWLDPGAIVEEATGDPYAALGTQLHDRQRGPRSFADPGAMLAEAISGSGAKAVVLWRIEEDEAQCWHLPAEREMLEIAGIPSLVLTRRDWLARDGARDEIESFLKEVQP